MSSPARPSPSCPNETPPALIPDLHVRSPIISLSPRRATRLGSPRHDHFTLASLDHLSARRPSDCLTSHRHARRASARPATITAAARRTERAAASTDAAPRGRATLSTALGDLKGDNPVARHHAAAPVSAMRSIFMVSRRPATRARADCKRPASPQQRSISAAARFQIRDSPEQPARLGADALAVGGGQACDMSRRDRLAQGKLSATKASLTSLIFRQSHHVCLSGIQRVYSHGGAAAGGVDDDDVEVRRECRDQLPGASRKSSRNPREARGRRRSLVRGTTTSYSPG